MRKETRCRHIGYSYRLTARVLLYAPSHRQDNTYHGVCYTSKTIRQTVVTDKVYTQYIVFGMEEIKPNNSCHFRNLVILVVEH